MSKEVKKIVPRMRTFYSNQAVPALKKRLDVKNVMLIPKLDKIVINMGVGEAVADQKLMEEALATMRNISGQKPVVCLSKKAISNFKLRENLPIGCKVTLRGNRMYEFFDRLVAIVIPRIRDFRGLSRKSFDGNGNYALGLKEQIVFLEVDRDKVTNISGMDICICTSTPKDEWALALLEELGMPFRK